MQVETTHSTVPLETNSWSLNIEIVCNIKCNNKVSTSLVSIYIAHMLIKLNTFKQNTYQICFLFIQNGDVKMLHNKTGYKTL